MTELSKKEQQAINLLKSYEGKELEICFSGGKDSEVILALADMAGCNAIPIHKNTTIDVPGTLHHCKKKGCKILEPQNTFLELVARKGMPTRRARWCCEVLKEYKVKDYAVQGVRRAESRERAARYQEPTMCRMYPHKQRVELILPLLDWTSEDVKTFIQSHGIHCHPRYYDDNGNFDESRRLGCIGCPLQGDRGRKDFLRYPKMLRAISRNLHRWEERERVKPLRSLEIYGSIYGLMFNDLFCRDLVDFDFKSRRLGKSYKEYLEEYFKVDLV